MKGKLTPRQQKVFEMLLNGVPPKEIAYTLGITYNGFLFHQKQIYRKLGVHSVYELVEKYAPNAKGKAAGTIAPESGEFAARRNTLPLQWLVIFGIVLLAAVILFFVLKQTEKAPVLDEGHPAVFSRWQTWTDKTGSSIDAAVTYDDSIDGKRFASYTMSGVLSGAEGWYAAGMILYPVPLTHRAMKRMTSFSFKVLGDGKLYRINIPTTDTIIFDQDMDHYCVMFPTINGEVSTITVDADDLMQQGYGKQVPFIRDNIESMEFVFGNVFFTESSEPFTLKIWDIRFF